MGADKVQIEQYERGQANGLQRSQEKKVDRTHVEGEGMGRIRSSGR